MTAQERVDQVRNSLAYFLVGSFVGALALLIFWGMPVTSKDIVTYMVGQLSGMAVMALDAQKTENTGKMAEAVTAAARAGTVDQGEAAQRTADAAQSAADQIKGAA